MKLKHDTFETFETKRQKMVESTREEISRLDRQRDIYVKMASDVLDAPAYMQRVQELYDFLLLDATGLCDLAGVPVESGPREVNWISCYATSPYGEAKPCINLAVDYEVEKIADVEGVLAALEQSYPQFGWEWATRDNSYGRSFSVLLPFAADFNVRLEIMASPASSNEEKCFRVIEKAEAVTTEVKTYRWICK